MIAPLIKWAIDRLPLWLSICLLLILWLVPLPYTKWYFGIQGVVFFSLGCLFARKKCSFTLEREGKWAAILCGIVLIFLAFMPNLKIQSNWARFILPLAFVVVSVGTTALPMDKMMGIMPHFFMIYALHGKPLSILQILYVKLISQSTLTVTFAYFVFPIVIISFCILVSCIWKRFFPRLHSIVTGLR